MLVLVIAALVLGLVHFLLHRRFVRATAASRGWGRCIDTVLVLGWVLAVVVAGVGSIFPTWLRPVGFLGLTWLAAVFYLLVGLAIIGVVLLGIRVVGRLRHQSTNRTRLVTTRVASGCLAIVAAVTVVYGVTEAASPSVTRESLTLERLPEEFDGMRVAMVSDLHLGPARGESFTRKVVNMVNEQKPDLIVVLGDLDDGTVARVGTDLQPMADLSAPMGVYGVAGNHEEISDDTGAWMAHWKTLGINPINNERTEIRRGAASIDIAGVYDYSTGAPYAPDLSAALRGRDDQRFVLLLAHQPNQAVEASEAGVDLQLSGHTHGGQMWPLRYIVDLATTTNVTGVDHLGPTTVFTTYGSGAWGPPVRVGAPPEIAILELNAPT
ncbi:metallophosphoesterase [Gordonia jacobaea]|uniref:metallophosphoesterase n=1 Tax=Gordonia jacobaea TaxID=122202 RepID=UPI003D7035B9